jgi:hypothetical protein
MGNVQARRRRISSGLVACRLVQQGSRAHPATRATFCFCRDPCGVVRRARRDGTGAAPIVVGRPSDRGAAPEIIWPWRRSL